MFKKFMCLALSLMMVLSTISVTGFAANYERDGLVASNVTFSENGKKAVIDVVNNGDSKETVVFWLGEYLNNVLVESDFEVVEIEAGKPADDITAELTATDENSVMKAYIWKDTVGGRPIAPVATYLCQDASYNYVTRVTKDEDGNIISEEVVDIEFTQNEDGTFVHNIVMERTDFDIPQFKFYAKDNSAVVDEPETYVVGANTVTITTVEAPAAEEGPEETAAPEEGEEGEQADEGVSETYVINISYKAPEFKNFSSADNSIEKTEIRLVPAEGVTKANYAEEKMKGASAYKGYPGLTSTGAINNPGSVTAYLSKLGHNEGEFYVFRTAKGPRNSTAWYYGGVGKYDGSTGKYFLTFDLEASGTMYLMLREGQSAAHIKNFVKEGFVPHPNDKQVYYKHFDAGETVEVPSMGWDESWGDPATVKSGRLYMDSTFFMFGYDSEGYAIPSPIDEDNADLKELSYIANGETKSITLTDETEYTVEVPTGTKEVILRAKKSEPFAGITYEPKTVTVKRGETASSVITVTSYDTTVTKTYTVNINEAVPSEEDAKNANLASLEYIVDGTAYELDVNDEDKTYTVEVPYKTKEVSASATPELSYVDVTVEPETAEIADGKATIVVTATAYDGTEAVYTINFEEDLPEGEDASDTALKALTYTIGEDTNAIEITGESEYAVEVPYGTKEVILAAEANYYSEMAISAADGKVAITESTLEDGTVVKEGKATVTVTAYDGTKAEYTVTFTPAPPAQDDATLAYLGYTIGDEAATEIALYEGVTDYYITLPAGTTADTVKLVAEPNVPVEEGVVVSEIVMPEAWDENNQGSVSFSVTALDGTTTVTYKVVFTAEIDFSKRSNKIYALTSYIGDKVKAENNAYMTEKEVNATSSALMIGENLDDSSLRNFDRTDKLYNPSDDMLGATYIRTKRYYGGASEQIETDGKGIIQRTYEADGTYTDKTGTTFGSGAGANNIRIFNTPEQKFFSGSDGWISFEVTNDCIVVVGDWTGLEGMESSNYTTTRYPAINPNVTSDSGWTISDGKENYIGGTSFYKEFKAGDKVVLPNYGLAANLSDTRKVEYIYNGGTVTETDVAHTTMSWEGVTVAVKWTDSSVSSNAAIASIKVGETDVDMTSATDGTYRVMAPSADTDTLALEVVAADENAFVIAPETIKVGQTVEVVVRAASGDSKTYYVELVKRDTSSTKIIALDYKIGDGDWTVVNGFEESDGEVNFTVPAIEYVVGGKADITVRAITEVGEHEITASGTLEYGAELSIPVVVESEDKTATATYTVTFEMAEKVFTAIVEATDEYKALFNDGQYKSNYIIKADAAPTYSSGTAAMMSWDANGYAKHHKYKLTINGEAYDGGATLSYAEAIAIKEAEEAAAGSLVNMTAVTNTWDYSSSKITTEVSSAFNTSGHNFGPLGSAFRNADFQVMTHREISPGRVKSASVYKDVDATKAWLRTDSNYLFTVTPNSKATVYVAFNNVNTTNHTQYLADGWKLIDSSSYYTAATLNALPNSAIIDEYETLPASVSRAWYMVEPSYIIEDAPYSLVKVQYDTGSGTNVQAYPYVWYKTVEEGDTLKVPTVGSGVGLNDQQPIKAFIIEGAHEGWEPAKSDDATLSSLKIGGKEVDLKASEYSVKLPYGTTKAAIEAVTTNAYATYTPKGEVDVADGSEITIVVTAEDGETKKEYKVKVSVSTEPEKSSDATLKSLSYSIDGVLDGDITLEENVFEYDLTVPSNADEVKLTAEKNDSKASDPVVADADLSGSAPAATVTVTAEDGTNKVYTVKVNKASVPFINIKSADSFIKEANTFKVYNAVDAGLAHEDVVIEDETERAAKKAEFQEKIDDFNAEHGTNAARGTSLWGTYPMAASTTTGAKLDNPLAFGSNSKTDADYIIDGDSWVFKSTKGGTPTADNAFSFGKNDEFVTFEISKPGTMYVVLTNGWGYKGGTDNGYTLVEGYTLGGSAIYEKHFEAGKVAVPAQDTDKYTIGTRQSNSIGFVFMFDDLTNADLKSISYKAGDNEGTVNISGETTEYEVEILPYTGTVEVGCTSVMDGTTVSAKGEIKDGEGTVVVTALAPDGKTTKEYTLKFVLCDPYKIVNATKGAGAAWVDGIYSDKSDTTIGSVYAADTLPLTIGTTLRYSDRTNTLSGGTTDNLSGATYIRTPKNEAAAGGIGNVRAYGESYTMTVGNNEPVVMTTKHNDAQVEGNIGFRTVSEGSWKKDFFSGAYDGKNGNPYWVTFVPTSDCTVIIGDNVQLDNVGGHDAAGDYPNLDKTLWKNNTAYGLQSGAERTYVRHFKAGEKVEIPNYGLTAQHLDTTPVVFTYTDADGATQTYETTVRDLALCWEDITIAIVWDDKSIASDAQSIEVNGELIEGFKSNVYEYEYILDSEDAVAEVTATYDEAVTEVKGLGKYQNGDTATIEITAGDGKTKSTYTIKFTFPKTVSALEKINYTVNGDEATVYSVSKLTTAGEESYYYIELASGTESIELTPVAVDPAATVVCDPAGVIALETEGTKTVKVTVGEEEYTVKIVTKIKYDGVEDGGDIGGGNVDDGDDTVSAVELKSVSYTYGEAGSGFATKTTVEGGKVVYYIEVSSEVESVKITANPKDEASEGEEKTVSLGAGESTDVEVKITAENGESATYTVRIKRAIVTDPEGTEDGGDV